MILYQLTTNGEMNFEHISEFIPFFEHALTIGHNLNTLEPPRVFKTHLRYHQLPKGPYKYIYIARDGRDVLTSYFHFHQTHMGYKGAFESFFDAFLDGKVGYGSWSEHVAEWQKHASDPNVLFLGYEDLAQDLSPWLPRIAEFCGVDLPEQKHKALMERCSFTYMKRHESKFDFMTEVLCGRGFKEGSFLRQGKPESWTVEFTPAEAERFQSAAARRNGSARFAGGCLDAAARIARASATASRTWLMCLGMSSWSAWLSAAAQVASSGPALSGGFSFSGRARFSP